MAYTVLSVILMSAILIFNRIKSVRSESPLDPLTLLEKTPQEYKLLALSVEEMCDYVIDNRDSLKYNEIDIITEIYPDQAMINFRSLGKPLDLLHAATAEEEASNLSVLKKLASSVDYDYVLGMNQSRVTIMFDR